MDGSAHLLALKVMRVSRPTIASSWQPFFSASPSFSAHSTSSLTSLQGSAPLDGCPKTLRDLTSTSQLLTLPSSFGAIQLGETFSSCLCLNNEAQETIHGVSLRIEMQTVSTKTVLADIGGQDYSLDAGALVETLVHHEIKELGQHVLACTVTYHLPPSARTAPGLSPDPSDPRKQVFNKYYKFAATNPLSVKSKVHVPRSPGALTSASEREKVFLEIHIQNLTQDPMWFEKMAFDPVEGWSVLDANTAVMQPGASEPTKQLQSIFSGNNSLLQPQDLRQYIYILEPIVRPDFKAVLAPGTIVPLGRLDISWRSSFGEPGRLLTSTLTRRVPLVAPTQPASALPPHLQRAQSPRPGSPIHRIGTPPGGRVRNIGSNPARPQSPSLPPLPAIPPDIEVDLTVEPIPRQQLKIGQAFNVRCKLVVKTAVENGGTEPRRLKLAAQHVQAVDSNNTPKSEAQIAVDPLSPISAVSTPSPTGTPLRGGPNWPIISESPRKEPTSDLERVSIEALPPPTYVPADDQDKLPSSDALFLGSSSIVLPEITVPASHITTPASPQQQTIKFSLTFIPSKAGVISIGGLRLFVVHDSSISSDPGQPFAEQPQKPRLLNQWTAITEVFVDS
ncbi:DUF974-domain-containing protein [Sistotremastrum niveocremeum HHB9708]|uniref:DUF974-domain-containing protein n=1 Tax=Sistotremastrum niveocremeum HHB9708 TaxID=1314777 RepID=A0A165AI15_9AGAM|nr:DUF974-domain-containing protein [Sistotremastrum niveocremeum HHB9708]